MLLFETLTINVKPKLLQKSPEKTFINRKLGKIKAQIRFILSFWCFSERCDSNLLTQRANFKTKAKLRFAKLATKRQKKQLYKLKQEKLEISLKLQKLLLCDRFESATSRLRVSRLSKSSTSGYILTTLAKNKAENRRYEISHARDHDYSKSAT